MPFEDEEELAMRIHATQKGAPIHEAIKQIEKRESVFLANFADKIPTAALGAQIKELVGKAFCLGFVQGAQSGVDINADVDF